MISAVITDTQPRRIAYPIVAATTVVHALVLGITPWLSAWWLSTSATSASQQHASALKCYLWLGSLVAWPLWAFPLWRLRDGRKGRFFAPIILGLVGLLPAAFLYLVMWAFFHYGPG